MNQNIDTKDIITDLNRVKGSNRDYVYLSNEEFKKYLQNQKQAQMYFDTVRDFQENWIRNEKLDSIQEEDKDDGFDALFDQYLETKRRVQPVVDESVFTGFGSDLQQNEPNQQENLQKLSFIDGVQMQTSEGKEKGQCDQQLQIIDQLGNKPRDYYETDTSRLPVYVQGFGFMERQTFDMWQQQKITLSQSFTQKQFPSPFYSSYSPKDIWNGYQSKQTDTSLINTNNVTVFPKVEEEPSQKQTIKKTYLNNEKKTFHQQEDLMEQMSTDEEDANYIREEITETLNKHWRRKLRCILLWLIFMVFVIQGLFYGSLYIQNEYCFYQSKACTFIPFEEYWMRYNLFFYWGIIAGEYYQYLATWFISRFFCTYVLAFIWFMYCIVWYLA